MTLLGQFVCACMCILYWTSQFVQLFELLNTCLEFNGCQWFVDCPVSEHTYAAKVWVETKIPADLHLERTAWGLGKPANSFNTSSSFEKLGHIKVIFVQYLKKVCCCVSSQKKQKAGKRKAGPEMKSTPSFKQRKMDGEEASIISKVRVGPTLVSHCSTVSHAYHTTTRAGW